MEIRLKKNVGCPWARTRRKKEMLWKKETRQKYWTKGKKRKAGGVGLREKNGQPWRYCRSSHNPRLLVDKWMARKNKAATIFLRK